MKSALNARREIVEAGAGCGKTTGLVARYIEGLGYSSTESKGLKQSRAGFSVSSIFCLTFTIEAAEQMKERILKRLRESGLESLSEEVFSKSQISTIHSLCFKLLRPYLAELGYADSLSADSSAQHQRKAFAMKALSEFEDGQHLLRAMPLEEILDITCRLWNSPNLESDSDRLTHRLLEAPKIFTESCRRLLREAEDIASRYNEVIASSSAKSLWVLDLIEGLREKNREKIAGLSFRSLKEIKESEPEFFQRVEKIREVAQGNFWNSLSDEALKEEAALESALKSFVLNCRKSGPRILDFSALEFELLKLLREKRKSNERLCAAPKLMLVDEFQDTNRVQMEILSSICDDETQWFLVGDPKQSIYAFRGSDVRLFIEAREQLSLLTLDQNYRSHPEILDFVNGLQNYLFDKNDELDPPAQTLKVPASRNGLLAQTSDEARVTSAIFSPKAKSKELWDALLADFSNRQKTLGTQATHAVLFQRWTALREFAEYLEEQHIPYEIVGSNSYLDHILTRLFVDFLASLDDPANPRISYALNRWEEGLAGLAKDAPPPSPCQDPFEALAQFSRAIECRRFPRGSEWLSAMFEFLEAFLGGEMRYLVSLSEVVATINRHARNAEVNPSTVFKSAHQSNSVLQLMTIHGSKGLQFNAVYLPELFEKRSNPRSRVAEHEETQSFNFTLEDRKSGERRGSLLFLARWLDMERLKNAEQKRLFYVALTRSIDTLSLYYRSSKSEREESKVNALAELLNWKGLDPLFWNDLLAHFESTKIGRQLVEDAKWGIVRKLEDSESVETLDTEAADDLLIREVWIQPQPRSLFQYQKAAPLRMGVSRYLEELESKREALGSGREESPHAQTPRFNVASNVIGNEFHSILEKWNGDEATVETWIQGSKNQAVFRAALLSLRKLNELTDYWQDLREGRVLREFGLFILDPSKRLSGFADAIWFPRNRAPIIVDWKSSSSLTLLKKADRLDKIRAQLELYQDALGKAGQARVQRMAVGIELSPKAKAEVLFFE